MRRAVIPPHLRPVKSCTSPYAYYLQYVCEEQGIRKIYGDRIERHRYSVWDLLIAYALPGILSNKYPRKALATTYWIARSRSQCAYP